MKQIEDISAEKKSDREGANVSQDGNLPTDPSSVSRQKGTSADQRSGASTHRPLTRSQTGRVPKRRRHDDDPSSEAKKRAQRPLNKIKAISESLPEYTDEVPPREAEISVAPPVYVVFDQGMVSSEVKNPLHMTQLTFVDGSSPPSSTGTVDRTGQKVRANLPVPVPNLTKKSRGRRVPTKLSPDESNSDSVDARMYICQVENCGKCFNRGEHLKRHIRSIHTHEKPFKCSHPLCDKHFNRHDNLLQHLKVHKEIRKSSLPYEEDPPSPEKRFQRSLSPLQISLPPSPPRPYYPVREAYEVSSKQEQPSSFYQQATSFRTYITYGSISEPTNFVTANMAVSSLRTELPQSPTSRRQQEAASLSRYSNRHEGR